MNRPRPNRDLARADAEIIAVRMRQIDERIRRATTRAPFTGMVISRARRAGEEVAQGVELAAMTDTDTLEVRAFVPLKHLARTHVGDRLDVFDDRVRVSGTIRALIPTGDIRSQTFEARIDLDSVAEGVASVGQLVSVAIPIRAAAMSLCVPRDALVLRAEGAYVFRINDDLTAEKVAVELGDSAGNMIAISGAIAEGDRVAIRAAKPWPTACRCASPTASRQPNRQPKRGRVSWATIRRPGSARAGRRLWVAGWPWHDRKLSRVRSGHSSLVVASRRPGPDPGAGTGCRCHCAASAAPGAGFLPSRRPPGGTTRWSNTRCLRALPT